MVRFGAATAGTMIWLALGVAAAGAQEPAAPVTPPAQTTEPAPAQATPPQPDAQPAAPAQQTGTPMPPKTRKGEYTGPTTVVELPPTPMLDEEGKQRLDPDGKPMFNPPVRQQRDKKGHPLFDEHGKPIMQTPSEMGYDEHGHKIKDKKEKPPKTVAVSIERGTLTVDGMTGKAGLNYQIADLKYIYLYAPWVGLTVVSNDPFPGAIAQKDAFNGHTLTVAVADHSFQVYSDKLLLGKKPEPAYVLVDRSFSLPTKSPVMGYGSLRAAPYAWPGSKENPQSAKGLAPPLPSSLRATPLLSACPAGQMRMPGPVRLPGDTSPPPPCVPIAQATAAQQAGKVPAAQPAPAAPPPQ